ncbi:hypothetical protein MPSI1_000357 [Malassezia psittaci]|uniref:Nudix hydrolase domain-containing protein n=1 Tax=Malassezia psittaci TaxID=1821823 RepID=A0AAF0F2K1_9BASI|nr:hypothetical protein MPSI1_000357 [Malassezia psittaci]
MTDESELAIRRLRQYKHPITENLDPEVSASIPAYRSAGVVLPLFIANDGQLRVLLTVRASRLSSHGGDTALPGGRFELGDQSIEETARREAMEEIGLPKDSKQVSRLCIMETFLSANELAVTPIVVLTTQNIIQRLVPNESEVAQLFTVPLKAFLYHKPPLSLEKAMQVSPIDQRRAQILPGRRRDEPNSVPGADASESHWHTVYQVSWLGEQLKRHTFWDQRNPIRGLTRFVVLFLI